MPIVKAIARGIAQTKFARKAIDERADLGSLAEGLTARNYAGIVLMGCSYVLGWPAVVFIGGVSLYLHEPLMLLIGAPVFLVTAHLVFVLGMYLAGGKYFMIFLRWATRIALERFV